jgi:hypothetical protein
MPVWLYFDVSEVFALFIDESLIIVLPPIIAVPVPGIVVLVPAWGVSVFAFCDL